MAEVQAQGTDGNESCTNSWEAAGEIVQLVEDRHQDKGGGLHGCGKERRRRLRRPRLKTRWSGECRRGERGNGIEVTTGSRLQSHGGACAGRGGVAGALGEWC